MLLHHFCLILIIFSSFQQGYGKTIDGGWKVVGVKYPVYESWEDLDADEYEEVLMFVSDETEENPQLEEFEDEEETILALPSEEDKNDDDSDDISKISDEHYGIKV